jgi:Protein tyrosine phosphatase-like protein, PTPLA
MSFFSCYLKKKAQWGAGVMILSWATVEVPRYLFYVYALTTGDATKATPYELFWLRYSLFAVLYPSGITGELTVFWSAAHDPAFIAQFGANVAMFYSKILPVVYIFGSPFMIMNMIANRKKAFKKRFAKPPPPPRGLVWPVDPKSGERSSTKINQAIVAAAVGAVNKTKGDAALNARGWRFSYWKHLKSLVEEQCTSPEACIKIAQAGLDKAYEVFEFVAEDGTTTSFKQAMASKAKDKFFTKVIVGQGKKKVDKLEIPYKGKTLSGQDLKDQINKWVQYGTIEPSCGEAMIKCVDHPEWITENSKRCFVLLGAGSAMGPLLVLMAMGANVVAIDLDRSGIWKRLIEIARDSMGTLTFPCKADPQTLKTNDELYEHAGCNLFTDTPKIRDWLVDLYPGKAFSVGCYAYLNGALHVQVSLAMDAICRDLCTQRKNTSLAYLCTPTDFHLIPKDAYDAQVANYAVYSKKLYCILVRLLSNGSWLRKNPGKPIAGGKDGKDLFYLVNGISVAQGPNYALAKRMQHWRAVVARNVDQCTVSSNIAPSTSTASVVNNRTFAWAYEGMPYFKPYEIFAPETSNAVMSAILLHDLHEPTSVGNPKTKLPNGNANELFSYGSFHGGVWRCAYELDSIGEASVILYFSRLAKPYLMVLGAMGVAAAAVAYR